MNSLTILKERGHRLTVARRAMLDIFDQASGPLSAGAVIVGLQKRKLTVNKTTVYRELEFLQQESIITAVRLSDTERMYERSNLSHHHQVVCTDCQEVVDVDAEVIESALEKLENGIRRTSRFAEIRHSLEFFGRCAQCAKL
jgi:Fur family ferric uptake transcriptional regulator